MMNQKEAVYQAVTSVCTPDDSGKFVPSKEQRAQVNQILFAGFRAGKIAIDRDYTDSDLKGYVSGLQSNWLRKDKRLNGGTKYQPKNPGSRAGSGDPTLKATIALLSTMQGPDYTDAERAEVQESIDSQRAAIAAAKQAKVINFDALPEALKAKFTK